MCRAFRCTQRAKALAPCGRARDCDPQRASCEPSRQLENCSGCVCLVYRCAQGVQRVAAVLGVCDLDSCAWSTRARWAGVACIVCAAVGVALDAPPSLCIARSNDLVPCRGMGL